MKKGSFIFFVWLFLLYSNSVMHFLKGFLLTRREIHLKSTISDGTSCCLESKYQKVIILMIDALRYDFLLYNNNTNQGDIQIAHNNIPIVEHLLKDKHGFLYQFIADPPTTTMQRLKGITTGSLPTFIDAGSNFASDELLEDNILNQIISSGLNITFMGDDTWMGLFPKSFRRSHPFPSFDVWDIHTVDRGVEHHIYSEMSKPDWSLLIAHCLGVDHVGHRYGPEHPAMSLKLKEMNTLIEKVIENMDSKTLLLVMGDHGMTRSGDHGGDSPDEVNAGLFAFSPQWSTKLNNLKTRVVSQVDIVPTLAVLFGIPIPYSNLGSVILDLVIPDQLLRNSNEEHFRLITLLHFSDALHLNAKQVWRYLETYNRESALPKTEFQYLNSQFNHLLKLYNQLQVHCSKQCHEEQTCCPKREKMEEFVEKAELFLSEAKGMCSSMWAHFDLTSISIGLVIFAFSLCLHLVAIADYESVSTKTVCYLGVVGSFLSLIVQSWSSASALGLNLIPIILGLIKSLRLSRINRLHLAGLIPFIISISYTSNSFVVQEPYVVQYLAQSLIWLPFVFQRRYSKNQLFLRAGLSLSTRLGLAFFRCREEQFPDCEAHNLYRTLNSLSGSNWIVYGRIFLALVSCMALYRILLRYLPVNRKIGYLVAIIWFHWVVQFLCFLFGGDSAALVYLPRLFYFLLFLQILHLVYQFLYDAELFKLSNYRAKISNLVVLLTTLAILLAGDGLAPGIVLTLANIILFAQIFNGQDIKEMWVLYGVLSVHGFFTGGHHTSLANIPWETAFVGFSHSSSPSVWANVLPVFLVSYSTAFSLLIHAMAVPIVAMSFPVMRNNTAVRARLNSFWLYLIFFHAIRLFGCMGAAALHRRHLMVWKIFAPRLLYELLFAVYTSIGSIISLVLVQATM